MKGPHQQLAGRLSLNWSWSDFEHLLQVRCTEIWETGWWTMWWRSTTGEYSEVFKVVFTLILLRTGFVWEQYNDRTGEGQVRRNLAVKFMILENTYLNDQQNLTFLFRVASLLLGGLRWLYLWWERHTEDCLARKRTSDSDILCVLCYLLGDVTYLWDEGNQYQFFHRFTFFRRFCLLPFRPQWSWV